MKHKFRVWDHENECWFHPTYGVYKGKMEELLLTQSGDLILRYMENGRIKTIHESMFEGRFEVNFSTPYTDMKGKLIYIDDIYIVHPPAPNKQLEIYFHVDDLKMIRMLEHHHDMNKIEVVGNKFETPELLNPWHSRG